MFTLAKRSNYFTPNRKFKFLTLTKSQSKHDKNGYFKCLAVFLNKGYRYVLNQRREKRLYWTCAIRHRDTRCKGTIYKI